MHAKETYQKKIESELRGVQVKLLELQTKVRSEKSPLHIKYTRQLDIIERQLENATSSLRNLDRAEDHTWEQLRDGVEDTWKALQDSLEDAISTFEGKHKAG